MRVGATGVKHRANICCWRRFSAATIGLGLIALAGCGGRYDASVSGVAKLNGSPLPSGSIVKFIPVQAGPSPYGLVDEAGKYDIVTGRDRGLPSGEYVVTVVANEPSAPAANPSAPPTPGKAITPAWYRSPDQSPLKYTVEPGSNEINLELDAKPPAGWKPGADVEG